MKRAIGLALALMPGVAAAGPIVRADAAAAPIIAFVEPVETLETLFANGLYAEYVARADASLSLSADERRRRAAANFVLGRYARVAEDDAATAAMKSVALVRLGACRRAGPLLNSAVAAAPVRTADLALARAECAIATGEVSATLDALRVARAEPLDRLQQTHALFLEGKARRDRGILSEAAKGEGEAAARASLALARSREAADRAATLWSGGAFDRELLAQKARFSRRAVVDEIAVLRLVIARHAESDAARNAQSRIAQRLAALFANSGPAPAEAARIFFDNVAFAPPGAEGDALIRQAVETLNGLGLHTEAAKILAHQVSKRLRGGERSAVAARLAEISLDAGDAEGALQALRSTRLHGLPAPLVERRMALEAQALARLGEHGAALALLEGAEGSPLVALRAEIAFAAANWAAAARAYATIAAENKDANAALRGVSAAVLAGDLELARAIAADARSYADARRIALLDALTKADARALAREFAPAYRQVYAAAKS
jgi:hypothetical protein